MPATGTPRYVDPLRPRGRIYRAWARFTSSSLGLWLSRHLGWKVDPVLLRLTRGRLGTGLVIPTALLETRGARSGRVRQPFRAEIIDDEAARARLWDLADRVFPPFAVYRERAARSDRTIPIVQLVPR